MHKNLILLVFAVAVFQQEGIRPVLRGRERRLLGRGELAGTGSITGLRINPYYQGRPGLASRRHPLDKLGAGSAGGKEQGQDALATKEIPRFQAVSQFKNRSVNLRFSFVNDDEIRKIFIVTQPVRSE